MTDDPAVPNHAAKRLGSEIASLPSTLPVTVHIGYPRTASTFLTKQVYHRHPDIITIHELNQLSEQESAQQFDGRSNVLVNPSMAAWIDRDRTDFAQFLKSELPTARILCLIRDQREMIRSQYFLYLKMGGLRSLHSFAHSRMDRLLHYERLYDSYADAFGSSSLLFLPYESLQEDRLAMIERVLKWIGVDPTRLGTIDDERVKPSSKGLVTSAIRLRNWMVAPITSLLPQTIVDSIYRRGLAGASLIKKLEPYIPVRNETTLDQIIAQHYGAENDRLFEKIGLPAGAYGYPSARAAQAA